MPAQGYTRLQIRLHWIIAVLIVLQFVLHDGMHEAAHYAENNEAIPASTALLAYLHVIGGMLVLGLACWRLYVRRTLGVPAMPTEESLLLRRIAHATHTCLYALMILMPLTGLLNWYGGVGPAGRLHEVGKVLMLLFVALHVAGAVYQKFVLKSAVVQRMFKPID